MERNFIFPDGFLWGSSSSAFQVEGGCRNHDFYDWACKGWIKDGTNPVDAVHFWKYYEQDIVLMQEMHHSMARIGIEWARIEPQCGWFDEEALTHYRKILTKMKQVGIRPMVTLHHFANPLWLVGIGGWTNTTTIGYFQRFTEVAVSYLGDLVDVWLTVNEPSVYAVSAYLFGEFPPGKKNIILAFRVMDTMASAHVAAYKAIHWIYAHKKWGQAKVGIASDPRIFDPYNPHSLLDRLSTWFCDTYFNNYFLDKIYAKHRALDILGINYYSGDKIKFPLQRLRLDNLPIDEIGQSIYPEGFYRVLKRYDALYRLPIYITENGLVEEHDVTRPRYILDHIYQMYRALQDGVDVRAYSYWSTTDNFELVAGIMCRTGLVHVDHNHPERTRTIKTSGKLYGEIAKAGGITEEIVQKYVPDWQV